MKKQHCFFIIAVCEMTPLEAVKAAHRSPSAHVWMPHW